MIMHCRPTFNSTARWTKTSSGKWAFVVVISTSVGAQTVTGFADCEADVKDMMDLIANPGPAQ
jgi:hypothetical protein